MNCQNCGQALLDNSTVCGNCHGVQPTQAEMQEEQRAIRNLYVQFFGVFLFLALFVGGLLHYYDGLPSSPRSADVDAYNHCRVYLNGQVQSTKTAHFESFEKSQVSRIRDLFLVQTNVSLRDPSGSQTLYVCMCILEHTLFGGWTVLDSDVSLAEGVTGTDK